jgi:geranylgeranyl pyrophosphate synthase
VPSIRLQDNRRLTDAQARDVVEEVRRNDGPRKALEQARTYADRAREVVQRLRRGDATDALVGLTDYVVNRKL